MACWLHLPLHTVVSEGCTCLSRKEVRSRQWRKMVLRPPFPSECSTQQRRHADLCNPPWQKRTQNQFSAAHGGVATSALGSAQQRMLGSNYFLHLPSASPGLGSRLHTEQQGPKEMHVYFPLLIQHPDKPLHCTLAAFSSSQGAWEPDKFKLTQRENGDALVGLPYETFYCPFPSLTRKEMKEPRSFLATSWLRFH